MSRRAVILFITVFIFHASLAQIITSDRATLWSNAGNTTELTSPTQIANILDFGGINDLSQPNDFAYESAVASLNGAGTIYFPEGNYLFNQTLVLPDSVWLVGESANSDLIFQPSQGILIQAHGTPTTDTLWFTTPQFRGSISMTVNTVDGIEIGDQLRVGFDDADLVESAWAVGTVAQTVTVTDIIGNIILFSDPLNRAYSLAEAPFAVKINSRRGSGIECLTVTRDDLAQGQYANISFLYAHNCAVRNVTSSFTDLAHVNISASSHINVEGCYFNQANAYGGGGQGYGVVAENGSCFNLIENNIFDHLRHSMLLQSGANGNVFGYNYSRDPFWSEAGFPTNAAGDLVLHGNYPYVNLFEGNVVQNIILDGSHGNNGPFNTFLRNRVELYGIIMDNSVDSDSMNFIGNEVTMSGFPFGNYALDGVDHLEWSNNVGGNILPVMTDTLADTTYYFPDSLALFGGNWQLIGWPNAPGSTIIPAQERYNIGQYTECSDVVITSNLNEEEDFEILQTQFDLVINTNEKVSRIELYSIDGKLIRSNSRSNRITIVGVESGIYVAHFFFEAGTRTCEKILIN